MCSLAHLGLAASYTPRARLGARALPRSPSLSGRLGHRYTRAMSGGAHLDLPLRKARLEGIRQMQRCYDAATLERRPTSSDTLCTSPASGACLPSSSRSRRPRAHSHLTATCWGRGASGNCNEAVLMHSRLSSRVVVTGLLSFRAQLISSHRSPSESELPLRLPLPSHNLGTQYVGLLDEVETRRRRDGKGA